MKISLRQLSYFAAAARTGSATRAASLLNVSQPSVSTAIRELEEILGQPLFQRRQARGLELTAFGIARLREARDILGRAEGFAAAATEGPRDRVALGYFATLGPTWLPGIVSALAAAMPGVETELRECDLEEVPRLLVTGMIDFALSYDVGLLPAVPRRVLAEIGAHALLPANHPLAEAPAVTLEALARHPFILIDLPMSRELLMVPFWNRGLSPEVRLRTRSVQTVHAMVAAGLGVSLLFTRRPTLADDAGRAPVWRAIDDETPVQRLILARNPARAEDELARTFADTVADEVSARLRPLRG